MPEVSILEPHVLNGIVTSFLTDISPSLRGLTLIGTPKPDLNPLWRYDVIKGNRDRSAPSAPNAEARRRDHVTYKELTGSYIYLRDKKQFNATTLRWLREPGSNVVAAGAAEAAVLRELQDIDNAQKRYQEYCVWQMFTGSITYTHIGGGTITIDYGITAAHKPTAAVAWDAAGADPLGDLDSWKRLTIRDADVSPMQAWCNNVTMSKLMKAPQFISQLSNAQKEQYTKEGVISRFKGLDWVEYDGGYVESGTYTPYIADNKIIILAPDGNPWEMKAGPSADDDAPAGQTGAFAKNWKDPDPSGRQILMEKIFFPVLFKPDQVVYATAF